LTVIVIIGVLATIATVFVIAQNQKARDSRRVADLAQVQKALELYYAQYGCYPASTDGVSQGVASTLPNNPCGTPAILGGADCSKANTWWNASLQVLVDAKFLGSLPHDPINSGNSGACGWCGILCYAYDNFSTDDLKTCGDKPVSSYQYALMFSTEKSTPSLPIWEYSNGIGTFEYCYVGKETN